MQKLIKLRRLYAHQSLILLDQSFVDHVDRDLDRRCGGPLAGAGLQQIELAFLNREFEILHVAIMLFQPLGDLFKLLVYFRHFLGQMRDMLGGANSGHDILALGVGEIFAVKFFLACRWITRETNAGGRCFAHVAEYHRLDIDRGTEIGRNIVQVTIGNGARVVPRFEDGIARRL